MIRAGIVGGTGYGGRELIRLLANHPGAALAAVASSSAAGQPLADALPGLRGTTDLVMEAFDAATLAASCDVVFLGVPSGQSMGLGAELRAAGARVIDIGADFRLQDTAAFKQYYKKDHAAPALLPEAVYGFVPKHREALRGAALVAVPGCYPLSVIAPLWPLMDAPLSDTPIVVDAISGVSGAGRSLSEGFHFAEMNENAWAYKVGVHQHIPEIEQALGGKAMVQFTPHVGPWTRGILSTITVRPRERFDVAAAYARYEDEPFIRVLGPGVFPQLQHVRATNFCDFGWHWDERTGNLVLVSALDNLVGGTAGAAIQCMNLMFGLDETAALGAGGLTP